MMCCLLAGAVGTVQAAPGQRTWPTSVREISSPFGMRTHPVTGEYKLHSGIDFPAPTGAPVVAATDGTVRVHPNHPAWGNYIEVVPIADATTLYAHLSAFDVADGQQVTAGQLIGRVGSTGYSTGPHLHFEVQVNGVPIDPEPWLAGAAAAAGTAMPVPLPGSAGLDVARAQWQAALDAYRAADAEARTTQEERTAAAQTVRAATRRETIAAARAADAKRTVARLARAAYITGSDQTSPIRVFTEGPLAAQQMTRMSAAVGGAGSDLSSNLTVVLDAADAARQATRAALDAYLQTDERNQQAEIALTRAEKELAAAEREYRLRVQL